MHAGAVNQLVGCGAPENRLCMTTFERLNALADLWLDKLAPTEVKIMVKAISHANNTTGNVTLAVETISVAIGADVRNTRRALGRLSDLGILPVVCPGGGRNKSATR